METQIVLLDIINPYILLGTGIVLIALEAMFVSFILIWFGLGFILTAFISMGYDYSDGAWQLGTVSIISLILILLLRKKLLKKLLDSKEKISDNFFEEGGIGEIKNSKVFFKGTYWEIDPKSSDFEIKEGEKIIVVKAHNNMALIKKR